MKKYFTSLKNKISNQVESFFSFLEKELTISTFEIPELYKMKNAHQELMSKYVHSITATSNLPLFVNPLNRIYISTNDRLLRKILVLFLSTNPIRIITLRPLVRLFIEVHIHNKLKQLEVSYLQMQYMIPINHPAKEEYTTWLTRARGDCAELRSTVSSGKLIFDSLKAIGISIISLIITAYGANSVYDLIIKAVAIAKSNYYLLFSYILFFFVLFFYISVFIDNSFVAKRSIFLNITRDPNSPSIYLLENNLFSLLSRRKPTEFSFDYLFSTIEHLIVIGFLSFIAHEIDKAIPINESAIYLNPFSLMMFLVVISLMYKTIIPWVNRVSKKET